MSSVWDTLNAMRARRAAVESSVKQHGINENAKKQACLQFDKLINQVVEVRLNNTQAATREDSNFNEVDNVLTQFNDYCQDSLQISNLIKQYQTEAVSSQLSTVKTQIQNSLHNLSQTSQKLAGCQDISGQMSNSIK